MTDTRQTGESSPLIALAARLRWLLRGPAEDAATAPIPPEGELASSARAARARFAPELSYGRHFGPAAHDARAAAVVALLYPHEGQWHVPLTLRSDRLPSHAGQISLPGGLVEPGESSQQAALRELAEELCVPAEGIEFLGELSPAYVWVSNFLITPHVAALGSPPAMIPCADEVAEILEVPVAALADPRRYGRHTIERRGLVFAAPHVDWQGHFIWGATSMILAELVHLAGVLPSA